MPPRLAHRLAALLALLVPLLVTTRAYAWVETQLLAAESRVELRRDGGAHVEHKVTIRVRGGPLRTLDFSISDRQIAVSGDANLTTAGDALTPKMPIPVTVEQRPDGDVRIEVDENRGVRRGVYDLQFGYDVDLLQAGGMTRDGSMLRVTWAGPRWPDGIDNVKCVLVVPASATPPGLAQEGRNDANNETGAGPIGSYLTTITRFPEFDEVALIRPHVAKNESVPWSIRIDPSAVGEVNDPRLHPPASVAQTPPMPPARRALVLGVGAAIALAFSLVLALKHRQVLAACDERNTQPRPLAPIGIVARVALAGPLLAAGLGAQAFLPDPTLGSVAILGVVALAAYRTPLGATPPRGPGRWLPLTDADAFRIPAAQAASWLDVSTRSGKVLWAIATLAFAGAVAAVAQLSRYHAHVAALDYVVLAAIFWTGRRGQLPADPVLSAAPLLRKIALALRSDKAMSEARVSVIGRVPTGAGKPDELRLVVKPRGSLRGFQAIEVGIAWAHGLGGSTPLYQALIRVVDGSLSHDALVKRIRKARWLRGRESHERVLALNPTVPTLDLTTRLVVSLVTAVREPAPEAVDAAAPSRKRDRPQAGSSLSSKARKADGVSSRTSNAGTDALPLQTTW